MRQLFLDTETTGLSWNQGHRIIELGIIEVVNRKFTGNNMHFYFKPDIDITQEAFNVHGISNLFLLDKPYFKNMVNDIMNYINGSDILIHNAVFDLGFLNHEISLCKDLHLWKNIEHYCNVIDTLMFARSRHPRQKNSLDALCVRYGVSTSHRKLHGALKDAELLAQVYLIMTGGQIDLFKFNVDSENFNNAISYDINNTYSDKSLITLQDIDFDNKCHEKYLDMIDYYSKNQTLWKKLILSNN